MEIYDFSEFDAKVLDIFKAPGNCSCEMMLFPLLKTLPCLHISKLYPAIRDFPRGPVVKNPAAKTGDMGWIPGPGQFHSGTGQLSPCTTATELSLWSPRAATTEAHTPIACALQ